jgi:hypothetical protein
MRKLIPGLFFDRRWCLNFPFLEARSMKLLIGCAAILGLSATFAMADGGRISHQSLANVGLGNLRFMSDSQGLEIRGLGVMDGKNDDYGDKGDKGDHHKGDKNKHHEHKTEHKHHEPVCHQHEQGCHTGCHVESLCHIQTCVRAR